MTTVAKKRERSGRLKRLVGANLRRLRRRAAEAMRPHRAQRPCKWIARCVRLDRNLEASYRVDFRGRPWWRDVVDAIWDPEVRGISVCAATQIGKTLMLISSILWCAENSPAPGMVVVPDRDSAIELRDRIYAHALATIKRGRVKRISVPPKRLWNTRYIDLGLMRVYLAWSGSQQRLRGRPCRYVWLSEIDVYAKGKKKAGDPVAAAHQRVKAFFRSFLWHESSPSPEPSAIAELEAAASARFRWQCECPKCGQWQELRFFPHNGGEHAGHGGICGIKDSASGEYLHADDARAGAHYVCRNGCKIGNELKQRILERGKYLPIDCEQTASGEIKGEQPTSRRTLGFQLWSAHSNTQTWGDLATAFLEARDKRQMPDFFGNWLGRSYRRDARVPHWTVLGRKLAGPNSRRNVPADAWFLTSGADVQGENNGVRYTIRAWAPGRTSWLVDWGWIERQPGDENDIVKSDLRELGRRVLETRFPVVDVNGEPTVNPLGHSTLGVRLLCIDSNHLPFKVHHWLRSLPEDWVYGETPRVRAIRGDHKLNPDTRWRMNIVETNTRSGETYEGGLWQWGVYVYPFYDELLQALAGEAGRVGSWHVTADCLQLGKIYLEQIVNFGPTTVIDKDTGTKKTHWGPRSNRIPVDFWDTEIYDLVAAYMTVGDLGWDPRKWEEWRDRRAAAVEQITRRRTYAPTESLDAR